MALSRKAVSPEFWARAEAAAKLMKRKVCLAPDEHRLPCGGSIIQAHTISRSQLQRIAENGHIYAFKVSVAQLMKNDGQLTISKIGISDFSVLNCFCQKHDMAIFSHIENDQLTFDQHQLLLLYFRALGAELYKATAALENVKLHQREVSRRPGPRGARLRELLSGHLYIKEIQVRDIALHFTRASDALSEGRYDHVSALVVHFKNMPSMMTAGAVPPEFDYEGKRLQDFAEEVLVEFPSLSILVNQDRASAAFIWPKESVVGRNFANSLANQEKTHLTTLLIQTAFDYVENTCMNITWWDSLKKVERGLLVARMEAAAKDRRKDGLVYGGVTFDDWGYQRHDFINCT